jgi:hypothetical protein
MMVMATPSLALVSKPSVFTRSAVASAFRSRYRAAAVDAPFRGYAALVQQQRVLGLFRQVLDELLPCANSEVERSDYSNRR